VIEAGPQRREQGMEATATTPLVSVVIPAYNAADTIMRALRSVWTQDYPALQVIVVNDGSTDDTSTVLRSLARRDVELIDVSPRRGAAAARNLGIARARGKYVAFLDADDEWLPGKTSRQVHMMESDQRIGLGTCDAFNVRGAAVERLYTMRQPTSGPDAWKTLLAYNFIMTPTVIARRRDVLEIGGFDPALPVGEDLDLWIRLASRSWVGVVEEALIRRHDRSGSLMKSYPELTFVLPMIDRYLLTLGPRLTSKEVRLIRARRYFELGSNLLGERQYGLSFPFFLRSAWFGFRRGRSLLGFGAAVTRGCFFLVDEATRQLRRPPRRQRSGSG
jgi:glycosyltransferase involved in cell wall biosynthesis